jgi:hypothetical protein
MKWAYFSNHHFNVKDPTVGSWLEALRNARQRTQAALTGINPYDAVVAMLRTKHHLLISETRAEQILMEMGRATPEQPMVIQAKGRNLITGLPAALEISSIEVQEADNTETALSYLRWSREDGSATIGMLLYKIAVDEVTWLYPGILQQDIPDELWSLFERETESVATFVRNQTLAQHWNRLETVRGHLIQAYRDMTLEDFQRARYGPDMRCSPEGVAHELCQSEAERRSEIKTLFAEAKLALETP